MSAKAAVTLRDLRAVAGSLGIVLSLLVAELLLVAIAHDRFGRYEEPAPLIAVLAAGVAACVALFIFAWRGKARVPAAFGDAGVLATLAGPVDAPCQRSHRLGVFGYLRHWLKSERRARVT